METNYFGPLKTIQAVLPGMRSRRNGMIINISSIAGLTALPSAGLYASSKFALEGKTAATPVLAHISLRLVIALSEALSAEVAEFNVRVLIVEPGAFRTNFLVPGNTNMVPLNEAYIGTATDKTLKVYSEMNGKQGGDVEKGCQRIYEVAMGEGMAKGKKEYLRLPLGVDSLKRARVKLETMTETMNDLEEIAKSTAFDI